MIFTVMGLLKDPTKPRAEGFQAALNEHLGQPFRRIISAGYLRDGGGNVLGVMAILDAETMEQAQSYLQESPFTQADLYERTLVAQYDIEVGRLD